MIKSMLSAASKMLELNGTDNIEHVKIKIECAKTVIDQVINSLVDKTQIVFDQEDVEEAAPVTKARETKADDGDYQVIVNDGKIVEIKNLPLDAKIELDGKVMTHQEAIGRSFENAKIV